jgi:hypothetical protein
MMADLETHKINEVYTEVTGENHILKEISEFFTFEVPDAKFSLGSTICALTYSTLVC